MKNSELDELKDFTQEESKNMTDLETQEEEPEKKLLEAPVEPPKKRLSKNDEAKELMNSAETLVHEADREVNSVKDLVAKSVDKFEEEKASMINTTMVHNMILLEKANFEHKKEESDEPFEVSLESMSEEFSLSKITSGRFSGFFLALIAIAVTALGWMFAASYNTGTQLATDKVPDDSTLNTLFTWIGGGMTGGEGNALLGQVTLVITALLVGWAIYKLRVAMRESRNYRVAHESFEKSHGYVESQQGAKTEMERVDAHIQTATATMADYRVLLDEQNGKLQRILHLEGLQDDNNNYHYTSRQVMEDSENLMHRMETLLSTPITKDGKINEASENALVEAQALYESYVSRLYNS